jgi:hypothetical protein
MLVFVEHEGRQLPRRVRLRMTETRRQRRQRRMEMRRTESWRRISVGIGSMKS